MAFTKNLNETFVEKFISDRFKNILLFFCLSLPFIFSGCASISPDIGDMTQAYSETVERHERNQILKNLLRAGDSIPMSFTTVPTIIGSGTLEASTGVTGQLYGNLFSNATNASTLRGSRGFNFTLSSLDNEKFISAFLGDIPIDSFNVFSSTDFHQQLFFTLLLDSVTFYPNQANEKLIENGTSTQKRFNNFQEILDHLISAGLRTEKIKYSSQIGVDLTRQELFSKFFPANIITDKNIKIKKLSTPSGERYRIFRLTNATRFCFSPVEFERLSGIKLSPNIACKSASDTTIEASSSSDNQAYDSLQFDVRSARDVYRFVGRLVAQQLKQEDWIPSIVLKNRQAGILAGTHPLIIVKKGLPAPGEKVLAVADHMGSTYYVPLDNAGFSSRVFEYLSLLLSTSMVKDAIPASPGILVR